MRHKNDYASVLLLDERYTRISIKDALPNWIKKSLDTCNYPETFKSVKKVGLSNYLYLKLITNFFSSFLQIRKMKCNLYNVKTINIFILFPCLFEFSFSSHIV